MSVANEEDEKESIAKESEQEDDGSIVDEEEKASDEDGKESDDDSVVSNQSEEPDQKECRVEILDSHYWEIPKGYQNSPSGRIALLVGKLADKRKEHVQVLLREVGSVLLRCRVHHRRALLPALSQRGVPLLSHLSSDY